MYIYHRDSLNGASSVCNFFFCTKKAVLFFLLFMCMWVPVSFAKAENTLAKATKQELHVSSYFNGMRGTALLYTPQKNIIKIYNEPLAHTQFSPFSTFKIASTLLGLENGIVQSKASKMQYNGTKYWLEAWNKDVNLQEAFQYSCVWYYHQLVYKLTPQTVTKFLRKLGYGNENISAWHGNGNNKIKELNGFWLDSSLKISPVEQVQVLYNIFEGKTDILPAHVTLLQEVMFQGTFQKKSGDTYTLYAKTGANGKGKSWFVGFIQRAQEKTYFAFFVDDARSDMSYAKQVALEVIATL